VHLSSQVCHAEFVEVERLPPFGFMLCFTCDMGFAGVMFQRRQNCLLYSCAVLACRWLDIRVAALIDDPMTQGL
jgi:hypothetical protein